MRTPSHQFVLSMALIASIASNIVLYRLLGRDASWGVGAQGAYHLRLRWVALWAWLWPIDLLHIDIDRLKQLNAALGESRVNTLLRQALRASDIYRSQHGDELMVFLPAGRGRYRAEEIAAALSKLPLTLDERLKLGSPIAIITVTAVVAPQVWNVRRAIEVVVARREALKAANRRGVIDVIETALDDLEPITPAYAPATAR